MVSRGMRKKKPHVIAYMKSISKRIQKRPSILVGTSGFFYDHWGDGTFYPKNLSKRKWLEYYTEHFDTVELNVAFYRLPTEKTFKSWYKRTPKDFAFALKGSRFITHIKRLKDCQDPLKLYFDRAKLLREKLTVILWQLPPRYKINIERLKTFIKYLRPYARCRHAFEFRDESWFSKGVYELLREEDMALCEADYPGMPQNIPATASFVYLRRHGPEAENVIYSGCYSKEYLKRDARRIKNWHKRGKSIYVYFNNDIEGWAIKNSQELKGILGGVGKT